MALPVITSDALLNKAEHVALTVLAADQQGATHRAAPFYKSPWLRDSYAWGMIPDDSGTLSTYAGSELRYWLTQQQPFGGWVTFQYSGWYDETAILIAAVLDAYRLSGDMSLVRQALPRLRRGWHWLDGAYTDRSHGSSCLLWASLRPDSAHWATDWVDQVARRGYTPQLEGLWYSATHAMAALEWLTGRAGAARSYDQTAACIVRDTNRLLWSVSAPAHLNAAPLPAFGHYRADPAGHNYFELDGNALLLALGMARPSDHTALLTVVTNHAPYLLGWSGAGPARVLYGDYASQDYGPIHNWMGPGVFQNGYWPSVGGLLAIAAARSDSTTMSLTILRGLAQRSADADNAFYEWYHADGSPGGAALYGWGARMYLLALYRAYLGVDDGSGYRAPADIVLRAAPGPARGEIMRLGKRITIITHGAGHFRYARLGTRILRSSHIPARLLYNGAVLDVFRGK